MCRYVQEVSKYKYQYLHLSMSVYLLHLYPRQGESFASGTSFVCVTSFPYIPVARPVLVLLRVITPYLTYLTYHLSRSRLTTRPNNHK
ncbi:hypothetical protein F5Y14DRAFT_412377 [Nemania sp. NC0429]|nr:hypothetical protein F5Y14DRAFT_412377 [Nemania sp. NC0429]